MSIAISIARAPKVVRQKATPIGDSAVNAYSINRKDAPQIRPATVYMATHGRLVEVFNFAFQGLRKRQSCLDWLFARESRLDPSHC